MTYNKQIVIEVGVDKVSEFAQPFQASSQQRRVLGLLQHSEVQRKDLLQNLGLVVTQLLFVGRCLHFQKLFAQLLLGLDLLHTQSTVIKLLAQSRQLRNTLRLRRVANLSCLPWDWYLDMVCFRLVLLMSFALRRMWRSLILRNINSRSIYSQG